MDNQLFASWKRYVKNLEEVLKKMDQEPILAVGTSAYARMIPALFIPRRSYQVYSVKDSADVDLLRNYAFIYCMQERMPKMGAKINSLSYLLKSYQFQAFLKSRKIPYKLFFTQANPGVINYLEDQKIPWIGNLPETYDFVVYEETFKSVLKKLKLGNIPDWTMDLPDFLGKQYEKLYLHWRSTFIVQAADPEKSQDEFYIDSQESLEQAQSLFQSRDYFGLRQVKLTPVIKGETLSMLGCVTDKGILTSPLHIQLVDVPEAMQGTGEAGFFYGYDFGYKQWSDNIEADAQVICELVGERLAKNGYKGVFGITFLYEAKKQKLYPVECKPRYTSSLPLYSMINLISGAPPIDFFTLAGLLKIEVNFDFDKVNSAWKKRISASSITLGANGVSKMDLNLAPGIYQYHQSEKAVEYLRPGAFLHELKNDGEFIIIDQVPRLGQEINPTSSRLFKFIFPISIAESPQKIKPLQAEILNNFANALKKVEIAEQGLDDLD